MNGQLNSAYPDPAESPGLALWRVTNSWQRMIRDALAPFALTHVQFVLLASLTWMDRSALVTQRDIADHAGTDVMMTSQVLRTLQSRGLVERAPHATDRRAWVLSPTPEGVALANRANAAVEAADRAYFAPLSDAEPSFTRLLRVLHRVHD